MTVVSHFVHYNTLLQNATEAFIKMRPKFITKCVRFYITKCISFVTKCDDFVTKCGSCYKMRRLLKNASVQTQYTQYTPYLQTFKNLNNRPENL